MSVIDDYLKNVDAPQIAELQRLRKFIQGVVPEATEAISYGMPGFKYKGKYLATFAAFKDHCSLFPGALPDDLLTGELKKYHTSKGTLQFTADDRLPDSLVRDIMLRRVAAIDQS